MLRQNRLLFDSRCPRIPGRCSPRRRSAPPTPSSRRCGRSAWSSRRPRSSRRCSSTPSARGSPARRASRRAVDWLEQTYKSFGIPVRREQYGTWRGWRQGTVHMEMIAPRVQNLEVELLAWSPPTPKNGPVEGDVVVIPDLADSAAAKQWLGTIRGKFVLVSAPEIMCRAPQELERYARPATVTKINQQRVENQRAGDCAVPVARARVSQPQDVNRTVYAAARLRGCHRRRDAHVVGRLGRRQDLRLEHAAGAERRPVVRGLRAAVPPGDEQAGSARPAHRRVAGDAGRSADVRRRCRAQGHRAA